MLASPDPQNAGGESDEAARWVADALENARSWFPEMAESELRGPLEQAFALANEVGRGEREFQEVFESELRRAIEEREVFGAAGSVLPHETAEGPSAFPAAPPPTDDDAVEPPLETPSYTRSERVPIRVSAEELQKYRPRESREPTPAPAPSREHTKPPASTARTRARRFAPVAVGVTAIAVAGLVIAALPGGGDRADFEQRGTAPSRDAEPGASQAGAEARRAARRRAEEAAQERAARERTARRERAARRADRARQRRAAQERDRTPAAPVTPPPTVAPPPPPDVPSDEFGLEP